MKSNENRLLSPLVLLGSIAVLGSACIVAARPPPPPPPRILPARDAVAIAAEYARSRGVVVDYTVAARLDRVVRWHVDLGGAGGRDGARVVLDGYSGRILRARLRAGGVDYIPQPQPGGPQAGPPPGPQESGAPPPGQAAPAPGAEPESVEPPPGSSPPEAPPPPPPASPPSPPGSGSG